MEGGLGTTILIDIVLSTSENSYNVGLFTPQNYVEQKRTGSGCQGLKKKKFTKPPQLPTMFKLYLKLSWTIKQQSPEPFIMQSKGGQKTKLNFDTEDQMLLLTLYTGHLPSW